MTATNNFSTEIGRGGFGIVFKGSLGDGKFVAVKVLSDASQQGPHEFLNEVLIIISYCPFKNDKIDKPLNWHKMIINYLNPESSSSF